MSLVFESSRHPPFLGEESYPPIDQAGDEVERYDETDDGNVGVVMNDVGDVSELAAAVAVSYPPPDTSILAENDHERFVVIPESTGDDGEGGEAHHHVHQRHSQTAEGMSVTAVENIAAVAAAAAVAAGHSRIKVKSSTVRRISHDSSSMSPPMEISTLHTAPRTKPIPKPEREVYRNAQGKFQCNWPDCLEDTREFSRKCEYNKHMDKHERPYRCTAQGCDKLPGFTYSGGLLRHEREVHHKHGGPRNPLHCPHETCKRHAGKGFSRQENLNEHLRRVHTAAGGGSSGDGSGNMVSGSAAVPDSLIGSVLPNLGDLRPLAAAMESASSGPPGGEDSVMSVATAAAAAAAAVAEVLHAGERGNNPHGHKHHPDSHISKTIDDDLHLLTDRTIQSLQTQSQSPPHRRKRTASLMNNCGDGNNNGGLCENGVNDDARFAGHDELREEVKRMRLENEVLRQQAEHQSSQLAAMMKQIAELQQQQLRKSSLSKQLELSDQLGHSEQPKQHGQSEQSEQHEQHEQPEQPEQLKQLEQLEQLEQLDQPEGEA